jgi:Cdc6-like AAA superfamily ATPase
MLLSIEVETKKGKQKEFILQCDFCPSKSRPSNEVENVLLKARQDGWITRYGTGRTVIQSRSSEEVEVLDAGKNGPAKWCCVNCIKKEQHLSTEEKLQKKLLGLSQDELDRICQP